MLAVDHLHCCCCCCCRQGHPAFSICRCLLALRLGCRLTTAHSCCTQHSSTETQVLAGRLVRVLRSCSSNFIQYNNSRLSNFPGYYTQHQPGPVVLYPVLVLLYSGRKYKSLLGINMKTKRSLYFRPVALLLPRRIIPGIKRKEKTGLSRCVQAYIGLNIYTSFSVPRGGQVKGSNRGPSPKWNGVR